MNKEVKDKQNNESVNKENKDPFQLLSEKIHNENIDETIKSLRKRIDSNYKKI